MSGNLEAALDIIREWTPSSEHPVSANVLIQAFRAYHGEEKPKPKPKPSLPEVGDYVEADWRGEKRRGIITRHNLQAGFEPLWYVKGPAMGHWLERGEFTILMKGS